eukprot:403348650
MYSAKRVLAVDVKKPERSLGCEFKQLDFLQLSSSDQSLDEMTQLFSNNKDSKDSPTHIINMIQNRKFLVLKKDIDYSQPLHEIDFKYTFSDAFKETQIYQTNITSLHNSIELAKHMKAQLFVPSSIISQSTHQQKHFAHPKFLKLKEQIIQDTFNEKTIDIRCLRLPFISDFINQDNEKYHQPVDLIRQFIMNGLMKNISLTVANPETPLPIINISDATDQIIKLIEADKKSITQPIYTLPGVFDINLKQLSKFMRKINYKFRYDFIDQATQTTEERQLRYFIDAIPQQQITIEEQTQINARDWGYQQIEVKKPIRYIEGIIEKIMEYQQ